MRIHGAVFAAAVALMLVPSCSSSSNGVAAGDGGGGGRGSGGEGGAQDAAHGHEDAGSTHGGTTGGDASAHGGTKKDADVTADGAMVISPHGDAGAGSCLGASFLAATGRDHLLVGGSMQAATAAMAPFDLQYLYISGGLADGTGPCSSCATNCTAGGTTCANSGPGCAWWGCWQYDVPPPGDYVRTFDTTWATATPAQIPMYTYYQLLQSSGVTEGPLEITQAANDETFMARYFADWRFLLQQIGSSVAILHNEPDFWGYGQKVGSDPTMIPAAVASANGTDCGSLPNTLAGMGQCMIAMTRKYAPKALVGLHASAWSTNVDVSLNTMASLDVAGEAKKTAAFLAACGEMRDTWWDDTNATLPDFAQDFAWVTALTEALSQPALWWQTPLGNSAQGNMADHYQDNRVDYFLTHMDQLAAAHGVGAAFGAGAGDQTTPESDGGNFVTKAQTYFSGGGQALCQ
jgi:hypothetical protein